MKHLLLFSCLFTSINLSVVQASTAYEQLCSLNKYWEYQHVDQSSLDQDYQFVNHESLIQLHLQLVEKTLRAKNVNHLTPQQQANRKKGLDILQAYWKKGKFPFNNKINYIQPVFIDDFNTACAVGHILRESGGETLAQQIAEENNLAFLEDMNYPELATWANKLGFTEQELRWIQPAYTPQIRVEPTIKKSTCGNSDGEVTLQVFSTINNEPVSLEDVNIKWYDQSANANEIISEETSLKNVKAGFYIVSVLANNDWVDSRNQIFVNDEDTPTLSPNITSETCSEALDGSIDLNLSSNQQAKWYNSANELISEDKVLTNVDGLDLGDVFGWGSELYNYWVAITDENGCESYQAFLVEQEFPETYVSVWQGDVTYPCEESGTGNINLEHVYGVEPFSFLWNDGSTERNRNNLSVGNYSVIVTDGNGCQKTTSVELTTPNVAFAHEKTDILTYNFYSQRVGIDNGQVWDFGDGTTSNSPSATHTYEAAGEYEVSFTGYSNNCNEAYTQIQTVIVTTDAVGVQPIDKEAIKIYPNPSKGIFQVINTKNKLESILVYNTTGQSVKQIQPTGNQEEIDLTNYSTGIYYLQIKTDKELITKKILVQ